MRPDTRIREPRPIQSLLLRIFLPAVLLVATALAVFAYNWHHATIIEGFDRKLVTTSALTGAMIDPEDHDALMEAAFAGEDPQVIEAGPQYRRNTDPIARIQERLDLTYLYTQALGGEQDIVYVLDGTEGDEHSPIGSPDALTRQTLDGLRKAEEERSVYISPVEYQEQWGLLKTAAAPVYDGEGSVSATAGADVNISVILVATQNALFASTLIGIGSILACLGIALLIMRMVARPIEALKDRALRVAAGQGDESEMAKAPREVIAVSEALTAMGRRFADAARRSESDRKAHELEANGALLARGASDPIHLVDVGRGAVFWLPNGCGADAALAALAARQLAARFSDEPDLAEHWRLLADTGSGVCVLIDGDEGTIELVSQAGVSIVRGQREIPLAPCVPQGFDPLTDRVQIEDGAEFLLPWGTGS
ncbi:MAG: histidine kinase [Erythrobacter sp.]